MKTIPALIAFISAQIIIATTSAQPGEWTWMKGDSTSGNMGTYGVQGVPSPLNVPPSFYEAIEWRDPSGIFWLYGGLHIDEYSALWMKCTHQGSELQASGDHLHCPSHGSEFNNKGTVSQGPAEKNLKSFPVSVGDGKIKIDLRQS